MQPTKEAKFLTKVLNHYERPPEPRRVRRQAILTAVLGGLATGLCSILFDSGALTPFEATIATITVGAIFGGRVILLAAYKNTHLVAPFVNLDALRSRIAELESVTTPSQ